MDPFYSQLLVTATLIMIAALFTVIAFDTWQTVLLTILFLPNGNSASHGEGGKRLLRYCR
jgi:uncharacterized membrane protein YjjP (DUF1212 family)